MTGMLFTFVAAPLAAFMVLKGSKLNDDYWKEISESLKRCNDLDTNQTDNLNFENAVLIGGTKEQRNTALDKILFPAKHVIQLMNYPSNNNDNDI